MTKFKTQNFISKVENARHGINVALRAEKNLRIHLFMASLVVVAGLLLQVGITRFCVLLLTIAMVISAEMFNSALEFSIDDTIDLIRDNEVKKERNKDAR